jgi:hypothetical protein
MSQLPLPPAYISWRPHSIVEHRVMLGIRTAHDTLPIVDVCDLRFHDERLEAVPYHHLGLSVDTIRIISLDPNTTSPPWTTQLSEIIERHAPTTGIKHLMFIKYLLGIHGIKEWICRQRVRGRTIDTVEFRDCGSVTNGTLRDYQALKETDLVHQVEWNSTSSHVRTH